MMQWKTKCAGHCDYVGQPCSSKIVIGDEGLLCIGSFNWFSATRDEKYKRYDTSMVYRGESYKRKLKRFIPAWSSGSYRAYRNAGIECVELI